MPNSNMESVEDKAEYQRLRVQRNSRASYLRHREEKLKRNEEWRKANWEKVKQQTYARRDPIKHKARQTINNAIKAGKFEKEACLVCGELKVDFHHTNGYDEDNVFTGIWLCRPHHAKAHLELSLQDEKH